MAVRARITPTPIIPSVLAWRAYMWRYADDHVGKILLVLFVLAAVVGAALVFLFANRGDDSWVWAQAEKAEQKRLERLRQESGE
jgi:hypothetical protein